MRTMASETNAAALDVSMQCIRAFIRRTHNRFAAGLSTDLPKQLIKNGFAARAATQASAKDACLLLIEVRHHLPQRNATSAHTHA